GGEEGGELVTVCEGRMHELFQAVSGRFPNFSELFRSFRPCEGQSGRMRVKLRSEFSRQSLLREAAGGLILRRGVETRNHPIGKTRGRRLLCESQANTFVDYCA